MQKEMARHVLFFVLTFFFEMCDRFNMPRHPLSELRPGDFPKIEDEENAFDSYNEDTDDECMEDEVDDNNATQRCAAGGTPNRPR